MTIEDISAGVIVQHFKRTMLTEEERNRSQKYMYEIIGTALHTETEEQLVLYRALYGSGEIYARPVEMFLSPVDREKYPEVLQEYRFELIAKE